MDFFSRIFSAIPSPAIPFLITILFYSLITIVIIWVDKEEEYDIKSNKASNRWFAMLVYRFLVVFAVLFTIWRIGFAFTIAEKVNVKTTSEFLVNIVLAAFGFFVFYQYYRENPELKKAILIVIWVCFLSLTFIICPYLFHESELSDNTLIQTLIVFTFFGVPEGIVYKRRKKKGKKDILEKRGSKR